MRAFKINHQDSSEIVAYENMIQLKKHEDIEGCEVKELCEVIPGCSGMDTPYVLKGDEEVTYGDYILEDGSIVGDETHSRRGMLQGKIDINKTNIINTKNDDLEFIDWSFDLWIGSYWTGSNFKVIVIEKY